MIFVKRLSTSLVHCTLSELFAVLPHCVKDNSMQQDFAGRSLPMKVLTLREHRQPPTQTPSALPALDSARAAVATAPTELAEAVPCDPLDRPVSPVIL